MSRLSSSTRKTIGKKRGTSYRHTPARRGPLELQIQGDPDDPRVKLARARLTKELALAEKYELLNAIRKGELIEVTVARAGFLAAASALRRCLESLVRNYQLGDDALDLIDDGFRAAQEEVDRVCEASKARARA